MRVFLTGATGFVGRAVVPRLQREGHEVVAWVRDVEAASNSLGAEVTLIDARGDDAALRDALGNTDAVINLAGAPVLPKRWTDTRKRELYASRVALTERLVACMPREQAPKVFISSSAIGYYGDARDAVLVEGSPAGHDFLAKLCVDWEARAQAAEALGVRVVLLRIGLVIGAEGGFLAPLKRAFELGLGGTLGNGKQWMSFIHRDDLAEIIATAVSNERYRGPVNAVMRESVTNREFTRTLARLVHRPALVPAPAALVRAGLGEAAGALLGSQRVAPEVLTQNGFAYAYDNLTAALDEVLTQGKAVRITAASNVPASEYLRRRRPTFTLSTRTVLSRPREEVFAFFSRAANLGAVTPTFLAFGGGALPEVIQRDTTLTHRIKVGAVSMRWTTHIEAWEPAERFADCQLKGPYRAWWHEHRFVAEGQHTVMHDTVYYALPLGVLGRIAHRLIVAPMLRRIFGYRAAVVRLRFGSPERGPAQAEWYKSTHAREVASPGPSGASPKLPPQ